MLHIDGKIASMLDSNNSKEDTPGDEKRRLLLLCGGLCSPVALNGYENFLGVERAVFVVRDMTLPSHSICYALNFSQDLDRVADYGRSLRPQYPIHLQEYVCDVAPMNIQNSEILAKVNGFKA